MNILIANRGLSALKFIISMREFACDSDIQIKLFGFVSPVDMSSKYKYITMLDQAIYTEDSSIYTNQASILRFCKEYQIHCLFPGWGYLSENEDFVQLLTDNGVLFLGPTYENMRAIGNKISCNDIAEKLGVPVLPWSGDKQLTTIQEIEQWCDKIGYPVMLKAGNSGGGKGIRIVRMRDKCYEMWQEILQEVVSPMIYATKYIENASHLEIQILGDGESSIHLHGRDCSTQRRNQKLIEECPIQKDKALVDNIQEYAVRICNHIGYRGLATVEFIYDQDTKDVFILEVNPRIQVEHIITEQLFGFNLIKLLYRVCTGFKLSEISELQNINYNFDKHVISMRINSENPYEDFRPTLGQIQEIDITYNRKSWGYFSVANDAIISEQVDSQFGHISAFGNNRDSAIRNLTNLVDGLKIRGSIYNTASFLKNFINDSFFRENRHTTRYLNSMTNVQLFNTKYKNETVVIIGLLYNSLFINESREKQCWSQLKNGHSIGVKEYNRFQKATIVYNNILYEYEFIAELNTTTQWKTYSIRFADKDYKFTFQYERNTMTIRLNDFLYTVLHSYHDDSQIEILINQHKYNFIRKVKDNKIVSPAGGKIVELLFDNGDLASSGEVFLKMECMKMILSFKLDKTGQIRYFVKPGDVITPNQPIAEMDSAGFVKTEYNTNPLLFSDFSPGEDYKIILSNNDKLLPNSHSSVNSESYDIPSMFSNNYKLLFVNEPRNGSNGYIVDDTYILLVNDLKHNNGTFSYSEDEYYYNCLSLARERKIPFVFVASNSGAEIKLNESLKFKVKPHYDCNKEIQYLFLEPGDFEEHKSEVAGIYKPDLDHYEITRINNPGVVNLDGSALLVAEMAKARTEIPTITFVIDRTVGVGAYLARLSERIIQRRDSSILLTGYQSINKVLGRDLYESNLQLGGPTVMANNGIAHKIVDTTMEGVEYIKRLLFYTTSNIQPLDTTIGVIIDGDSFCETMDQYAKNVIVGRCSINGRKYGIIYPARGIQTRFTPCDPADTESVNKTEQMSPNILYPDTSYKIAKTIRDCNVEGIPLLIIADWRGFSGGTRDMFDQVLDFGSMIVSELAFYKQPVTIYVPPGGQLRGGSMVVFSKSINKDKIRFYIAESARINVLEPNATKELKFKNRAKYADMYNTADVDKIADIFVELNDRVNPESQRLNQYEKIIDGVVEPILLKNEL